MRIAEQHQVAVHGVYRIMEGEIIPDDGPETRCFWVENLSGEIVSPFTSIEKATGIAEHLAELASADDDDGEFDDDDLEEDGRRPPWLH